MKIIVTHSAPDLDAIASSWIIKRFLPGWENAEHHFVAAGGKISGKYLRQGDAIEKVSFANEDEAEVIHVDTGLGPLDHHQTGDDKVAATSRAFDYVIEHNEDISKEEYKLEALREIVNYAVADDHFQEVFFINPNAPVYDFSIVALIHGIKMLYPKDDLTCLNFGMEMLDSAFHYFENKVWAEKEIEEKGIRFDTKWDRGIAIETHNDTVLKLGQVLGNVITVRKDPDSGSVRIKARPKRSHGEYDERVFEDVDVDLTGVYEELKKRDPSATWFLHVSKRMLLNGSSKNTEMKGSKLTLDEVVEVLQNA